MIVLPDIDEAKSEYGSKRYRMPIAFYLILMVLLAACVPATGSHRNFSGKWIAEDANTRGITRISIRSLFGSIVVQMWGKCHPTDCYWGEGQAIVSETDGSQLILSWNPGFSSRQQVIRKMDDGRLQVDTFTKFTDNSGREDNERTEWFIRP